MKKALVITAILGTIAAMIAFPHTMISPGELLEGHQPQNNDCLSCHAPFSGIPNEKCISCHKPEEIGKDSGSAAVDQKILFHHKLTDQQCTSCHTDHLGRNPVMPVSTFDHKALASSMITNCNGCHGKPDDNLHRQLPLTCNKCHSTDDWKNVAAFNHNLILAGGKRNCSSCHTAPEDDFHPLTKENCVTCHTVFKWKPSTFDHSKYFILDKDHNVSCNKCHTKNSFSLYTCYGCHEHEENEMIREHREEGITNISDCVSCHKSSDEDNIVIPPGRLSKSDYAKVQKHIKGAGKSERREKD